MDQKETELPIIKMPTLMSYRPAQLLFEAAILMLVQFDRLDLTRFGADRAALDVAVREAMGAIVEREECRASIEKARDEHATDELEIDDDPVVSISEGFGGCSGGVFVSAWIYVPNADIQEEECDHDWVCTGTEAGGDDARFHGEGRMLCSKCGADGDA